MKNIAAIIVIILFFSSAIAQDVPKLRIDPAQAYGGTVSEYFSNVNYIPLETTKESIFGAIGGFEVTDSSYVISDQDTHSVLFFNKAGKFIRKIKFRQDQYPYASYLKDSKIVIVSVYDSKEKKSVASNYTITGIALGEKIKLDANSKIFYVSMGGGNFLKQDNCYYSPDKGAKDTVINQVSILKGDSVVKKYLPVNQSQNLAYCAFGWASLTASHNQQGVYYACTPFVNDVYRITKDSIVKIYKFVFPLSRTMSKDILETKDVKVVDSFRNSRNWESKIISGVSNIYFHKDLLLFKIDAMGYILYQGSENTQQYNFIYNLKTGRLASFERMTPDSSNYYLPLMGGTWTSINGAKYTDGHFYTNIPSLQMFTAKEATKDKNPKYNSTLENYFKNSDRKSNPVIVQMKLKD